MKTTKAVLTSYVQCSCCYRFNPTNKIQMPLVPRFRMKNKLMEHFVNGIMFKIPMCCVIYYCYMSTKDIRVARIVERKRIGHSST